jgi:hypothetical protein
MALSLAAVTNCCSDDRKVLGRSTAEAGAGCDPICSIDYVRGDCQAIQSFPMYETHDIPSCNVLSS